MNTKVKDKQASKPRYSQEGMKRREKKTKTGKYGKRNRKSGVEQCPRTKQICSKYQVFDMAQEFWIILSRVDLFPVVQKIN